MDGCELTGLTRSSHLPRMGRHPPSVALSSNDWAERNWPSTAITSPIAQLPMKKRFDINMSDTSKMGDCLKTGRMPVPGWHHLSGLFHRNFRKSLNNRKTCCDLRILLRFAILTLWCVELPHQELRRPAFTRPLPTTRAANRQSGMGIFPNAVPRDSSVKLRTLCLPAASAIRARKDIQVFSCFHTFVLS
jgi:hypothetical protein